MRYRALLADQCEDGGMVDGLAHRSELAPRWEEAQTSENEAFPTAFVGSVLQGGGQQRSQPAWNKARQWTLAHQ